MKKNYINPAVQVAQFASMTLMQAARLLQQAVSPSAAVTPISSGKS